MTKTRRLEHDRLHLPEVPAAAGGPAPASTRWFALAVLCVTLLLVTLDVTVLNVALPTIVRDLNATTTELQWIVDAYVIVFAGLLLAVGSLADRIGRRKVFLAGLVVFAVDIGVGRVLRVGGNADRGARRHGRRRSAHDAVHAGAGHRHLHRRGRAAAGDQPVGRHDRRRRSRSARLSAACCWRASGGGRYS